MSELSDFIPRWSDLVRESGEGACSGDCSRRGFLRQAITVTLGSMSLTVLPALAQEEGGATAPAAAGASPASGPQPPVYGYLIDIEKCSGSGKCLTACRAENDVPSGFHRTWLERYIRFKDGKVKVELVSEAGVAGLSPVDPESVAEAYFVPKLCNHCHDAPCNQVCPVHASLKSPEGFELVDAQRCIGCAYCVQACPYGARFINPDTGTADKCTWCYHRVKRNERPACVEACPTGARLFGRLDDPDSEISKRLAQTSTHVLKQHLGTGPKTRYVKLPQEVN